jgi:hypothetical protein
MTKRYISPQSGPVDIKTDKRIAITIPKTLRPPKNRF